MTEAPKCWRCGAQSWAYTASPKFPGMFGAKCQKCGVPEGLFKVEPNPSQAQIHEGHASFLATFETRGSL